MPKKDAFFAHFNRKNRVKQAREYTLLHIIIFLEVHPSISKNKRRQKRCENMLEVDKNIKS
jgi:hypothetical protein